MEQIYFGQRIAALRKLQGMTQEALAQRLGITNQAVSKWESDQCCPDIMQLPVLADIFKISLDALFGRQELPTPVVPTATIRIEKLPWEDNDDLHAVCYVGHRLVQYKEIPSVGGKRDRFPISFSCMGFEKTTGWANEPVQLTFSGSVENVYSDYSVMCTNSVIQGNVQAGDGVNCADVQGDVHAGECVSCASVGGDAFAGDSITCRDIGGNAQSGEDLQCEGTIHGTVTAGADVECSGNITGRVQCGGDLECHGSVYGDIRSEGDVRCSGDITGNVTSDGDVDCTGSIGGNATADGSICCGNIHGSASAEGDIHCTGLTNA